MVAGILSTTFPLLPLKANSRVFIPRVTFPLHERVIAGGPTMTNSSFSGGSSSRLTRREKKISLNGTTRKDITTPTNSINSILAPTLGNASQSSARNLRLDLTRVSLSQLFLVGGNPGINTAGISNRVAFFNVDKLEWKEEAPLSSKFGGNGRGLKAHQAFEMQNENGVAVICIGGWVDAAANQHPDHLAIFDFS